MSYPITNYSKIIFFPLPLLRCRIYRVKLRIIDEYFRSISFMPLTFLKSDEDPASRSNVILEVMLY